MPDTEIIAPTGELDLHAARELAPQLNLAAGASYPRLILDLTDVTFVDSTGLGAILQAHQRFTRQGRTLSLVAPHGSAAAVLLDLSGLRTRMAIFPSRDAALAG
jgi:anti-sigma B factor antagonist